MRKYIYHHVFIVLCLLASNVAQSQIVPDTIFISLDDTWNAVYDHSKELKEQELKTAIGDEQILDAKRSRLPTVDIGAKYGKLAKIPVFVDGITHSPDYIALADNTIYGVNAEAYFNIYSGGAIKTSIKKAEAKKELLEHVREETADQLHMEVIQDYLDLQRFFEFKKLIRHNIEQSKERLRQISELHESGVVLKSDLLRAQLQLSQQQTQLVTIDNNIVLTAQALNILMNTDDETIIVPRDSIGLADIGLTRSYSSYVDESLEKSPLEHMAEQQIELSELEVDALKSDKLPKIGLFGTYSYSYPQIMLYPYDVAPYLLGMAGIKLTYDFSALYHDKHKEKAAELQVAQQRVAKENVEDHLRQKIKTAYQRFLEDMQQIDVAESNIAQAQENYRIVDQTYFAQLALLTDLLDADSQLLRARFELVNHLIAAKLHYYQLIKTSGEL